MILAIVALVAFSVPVNTMARMNLGTRIHAVLQSGLYVLVDGLCSMPFCAVYMKCLTRLRLAKAKPQLMSTKTKVFLPETGGKEKKKITQGLPPHSPKCIADHLQMDSRSSTI